MISKVIHGGYENHLSRPSKFKSSMAVDIDYSKNEKLIKKAKNVYSSFIKNG